GCSSGFLSALSPLLPGLAADSDAALVDGGAGGGQRLPRVLPPELPASEALRQVPAPGARKPGGAVGDAPSSALAAPVRSAVLHEQREVPLVGVPALHAGGQDDVLGDVSSGKFGGHPQESAREGGSLDPSSGGCPAGH